MKTSSLHTSFIVILCVICVPGLFTGCRGGPDQSRYDVLKNPCISKKPGQKMIVVEMKGDPNETGGKAFPVLFKTYFGLKKQVKDLDSRVAPRARWPEPFDTPRDSWVGIYGLPVPESVIQLPDAGKNGMEVKVNLEYWEYGEVAEILHVGPYSKEGPDIKRVRAFIDKQGYEIAGAHEEEYLVGPGMFFKGNPEKYKTIIRYPVKKKN